MQKHFFNFYENKIVLKVSALIRENNGSRGKAII
jgi:hypothetical protein